MKAVGICKHSKENREEERQMHDQMVFVKNTIKEWREEKNVQLTVRSKLREFQALIILF
jgi:hypothetical protein